ncbi:MAG: FxLYD domain-containing protein, partial [Anaerolineae bacterium]
MEEGTDVPVLELPACPICGAAASLVRQVPDLANPNRTTYTCWECESVLVWMGEDLWLHDDQWVYQRIGRADKQYLASQPLTSSQLYDLARQAPQGSHEPGSGTPPEIVEIDATPPGEFMDDPFPGDRPPSGRYDAGPPEEAWARASEEAFEVEEEPRSELVPMAQLLPEGMTLALVRYEGARMVPVAVLEEGQLRAIPAARRRSRGSPILWISLVLVMLCLCCSASIIVSAALLEGQPIVAILSQATAQATAPPAPTAPPPLPPTEPPPLVAIQGVSDYGVGTEERVIVGEVVNGSGQRLQFVEVLARFYDGNGGLAGTGSTFAEIKIVDGGGRAPFKLTAAQIPASFQTYELRLDYMTTDQPPLKLEIVNHQASVTDGGEYRVEGEVRNPLDFAVKFVKVVATYYRANNKIAGVETTLGDVEVLQPGETAPFVLILANPPAD